MAGEADEQLLEGDHMINLRHISGNIPAWAVALLIVMSPSSTLAQQTNNKIYKGGKADGYAFACYSQKDKLDKNNRIFSGGLHDGAAVSCFAQKDPVENNNRIFAGGTADGFRQSCYSQGYPEGLVNNRIFRGGRNDGLSQSCYEQNDNPNNPLPVQLLGFEAEPDEGAVLVRWQTATEKGNDHFIVERSADGKNYHPIAQVDGAGTTTRHQRYKTRDEDPLTGVSYYRLKQIDMDGDGHYTKPDAVRFQGSRDSLKVYPNPASSSGKINILLGGFEQSKVLVVLRGVHGKKYFSKVFVTGKSGSAIKAMELNDKIPAGIYFAVASSNDRMYRKKVVIQ